MSDPRQLLDRFITAKSAAGKADRTLRWYADLLGAYLEYVEAHGLDWWQTESVESFQAHLWLRSPKGRKRQVGFKPNSVDCYYRALRAWCNWLVRRKLMPGPSPMEAVERPTRPSDPVGYVTLPEFTLLLHSIKGDEWTDQRDRCLLMLMFWSGLRVAELTSLRVADVDIAKRLVTVHRGKGGKSRIVPCAPDLGMAMLAYLMARPAFAGDALFASNDGYGGVRGELGVVGVRLMLRRRCKDAGLRYMHPHLFRHGFAMLFLNNGMQLSAVSAAMGHSDPKVTTDIYAHWLTDGLSREYDLARTRVERTQRP
jgi:integrase/recombinase XerC